MKGYKFIKVNGKIKTEHRYIMEKHLGRELNRNEVVHHINEIKTDNRICNLMIMSISEHSRLHHLGKKYKKSEKISIQKTKYKRKPKEKISIEQRLNKLNSGLPEIIKCVPIRGYRINKNIKKRGIKC